MCRQNGGSPQPQTPQGNIAARMLDNLLNMAVELERGRAVTEERRRILNNLFEQVWDVEALETKLPLCTGADAGAG